MKSNRLMRGTVLLALVTLLATGATLARVLDYDAGWWTADGGGGTSSGGSFALSGSVGQPDAGAMQGGSYSLSGGFWAANPAPETGYDVFLPAVIR
jgi:hypothetical protein